MLKYILKRIGLSIVILIGVSLIIYFLIRLMPVDFIQNKVNAMNQSNTVPADAVEKLYEMYGLDNSGFKGIVKGYFNWLGALAKLDLGRASLTTLPCPRVSRRIWVYPLRSLLSLRSSSL